MSGIGRTHLRLLDIRRVYHLIGEISELHGHSLLQRQRVIDGIGELLGVWIGFLTDFSNFTKTQEVDAARPLFTGDFDTKCLRWFQHWAVTHQVRDDGLIDASVQHPGSLLAARREELVDLRDFRASPMYCSYRDATSKDIQDSLVCFFRQRDPSQATGIALHRDQGDLPFTERDRDILRLFAIELYRLYRMGKFAADDDLPDLSPRQQQVLKGILEGRDAKGIAEELGLSRRTIDEYTLAVYDKFGVHHRGELMARFIRRPPPPIE